MRISRTTEAGFAETPARQGDAFAHLRLVCDPATKRVAERVAHLADSVAESLGFAVVRVSLTGGRRLRLQVMAERADGSFSVEDCARLSRALSPLLDAQDQAASGASIQSVSIQSAYVLEVSSAGLERPLTRAQDFVAHAGKEVELKLNPAGVAARQGFSKRKKYRGVLMGLQEETLLLQTAEEESPLAIALAQIAEVCLYLSAYKPASLKKGTKNKKENKKGRGKTAPLKPSNLNHGTQANGVAL